MMESDNLYAESIGRAMSSTLDIDEAIGSIKSFLRSKGVDSTQVRIKDFSGLSRTNYLTPNTLASVLCSMATNSAFVKCFPVVGREGTVKRLLTQTRLQGRLRLKSGSMTGVLCYAGYKTDTSGHPTHVVVIMVNNTLCKHSVTKQYIEQWLLKNF